MADFGLTRPIVSALGSTRDAVEKLNPVPQVRPRWADWLLLPSILLLVVALVPWFLHLEPDQQDLRNRLASPVWLGGEWAAPIGTDSLGRDLLDRVLVGARLSLSIGLLVTVLSCLIGLVAGLAAAIGPKLIDTILTLLAEVTLSLPLILVGVVVTAIIGPSMRNLIALMVFSGWIGFARLTRLQAKQIRQTDYVLASRAMGARSFNIALRHLLPNLLPAVLTLACQNVAGVMLWEASLTYLGLGLPMQEVSLGGMIRAGQDQLFEAWWVSFMPGVVIAFAVVALAFLSDWLRLELDPATRRRWRRM